jgi:methyltransferase-like protein/ubiquinone/menaquinone biosynthesis C-methylase UbiE
MSEEQVFAYDKLLYPNYLHTQTHPDRLATISRFFGINSKPVENCRVLELGCGTGGSLLSFAYDLPDSEFIGIDLSEKQIEHGKIAVQALGLKNLTLRQGDIMNFTRAEFGEFDYIVAHGLYAWVPDVVRDKIMKICRETLAPHGVAFISYNAFPGCHLREMSRGMMRYHTRNITSPIDKVQAAVEFLKFMVDVIPDEKIHGGILQKELENINQRNPENIYHDELADFSHPVYFYEFAEHAKQHDLQFVSEAEYFTGKNANFPKEVLQVINRISEDVIAQEQYLDFITGRRFRQSLLCHKELNISREPDPQVLRQVRIASPLNPVSEKPELSTSKHEVFVGEKQHRVEIDHPLTKAALYYLGKIWARSITFEELVMASKKLLQEESHEEGQISERDEQILTEILFQIFCSGILRLHVHEPHYVTGVSEKPMASPLARWEAQTSYSVSTLLCTSVNIQDALGRELLRLADGTRTREQLIAGLTEFINSAEFDQPTEIKNNIIRELPSAIEANLNKFAQMALLVS